MSLFGQIPLELRQQQQAVIEGASASQGAEFLQVRLCQQLTQSCFACVDGSLKAKYFPLINTEGSVFHMSQHRYVSHAYMLVSPAADMSRLCLVKEKVVHKHRSVFTHCMVRMVGGLLYSNECCACWPSCVTLHMA